MVISNNIKVQCNIKGYKLYNTVNTNNITIKEYTDGVRVVYGITGTTTVTTGVLTNKVSLKPVSDVTIELNVNYSNAGGRLRIATDGGMQIQKNNNSGDSCTVQSSATTFLSTPLI